MARRFCRDAAHLIPPIEAFPARAASRASADPTKTVAPGEPLTGLTGTGAGAVPGEIGKDAQGPRLADQGDTFGHVPAMPLGDEPQRGLSCSTSYRWIQRSFVGETDQEAVARQVLRRLVLDLLPRGQDPPWPPILRGCRHG